MSRKRVLMVFSKHLPGPGTVVKVSGTLTHLIVTLTPQKKHLFMVHSLHSQAKWTPRHHKAGIRAGHLAASHSLGKAVVAAELCLPAPPSSCAGSPEVPITPASTRLC